MHSYISFDYHILCLFGLIWSFLSCMFVFFGVMRFTLFRCVSFIIIDVVVVVVVLVVIIIIIMMYTLAEDQFLYSNSGSEH